MKKIGILITIIMFFVVGCQNDQSNSKSNKNSEFLNRTQSESSKSETRVYYRFPSPNDIISYINQQNLDFNPYLPNSTENVEKYINSHDQALNLGVYIADLVYITLFNNLTEAINYFEAVENLSYKVRVSSAFDQSIKSRIQNNLNQIDSLNIIAIDAYNKMVTHLSGTDNDKTLAIISAGAYIETLYLSINQFKEYSEDDKILKKIFEQKFAFENLLLYMNEYNNDASMNQLVQQINEIKEVFDKTIQESPKQKTQVVNNNGSLVFSGGGYELKITEDHYMKLKSTVLKVRSKITEN